MNISTGVSFTIDELEALKESVVDGSAPKGVLEIKASDQQEAITIVIASGIDEASVKEWFMQKMINMTQSTRGELAELIKFEPHTYHDGPASVLIEEEGHAEYYSLFRRKNPAP